MLNKMYLIIQKLKSSFFFSNIFILLHLIWFFERKIKCLVSYVLPLFSDLKIKSKIKYFKDMKV